MLLTDGPFIDGQGSSPETRTGGAIEVRPSANGGSVAGPGPPAWASSKKTVANNRKLGHS